MPVIHACHPCPPPIPNYTNQQNHTKPYQISSLYLQWSITAISIHNATQLSCHFQKIATVSHFRLVFSLSSLLLWGSYLQLWSQCIPIKWFRDMTWAQDKKKPVAWSNTTDFTDLIDTISWFQNKLSLIYTIIVLFYILNFN